MPPITIKAANRSALQFGLHSLGNLTGVFCLRLTA
jgi:hypothetical protein